MIHRSNNDEVRIEQNDFDLLAALGSDLPGDVKLAVRKSRGDAVHEVEKLDAATAF